MAKAVKLTPALAAAQEARRKKAVLLKGESAEQKFARLASERTTQALGVMRRVKNTASYPHTPEQGRRIITTLRNGLAEIERSFSPALTVGRKGGERFDVNRDVRDSQS